METYKVNQSPLVCSSQDVIFDFEEFKSIGCKWLNIPFQFWLQEWIGKRELKLVYSYVDDLPVHFNILNFSWQPNLHGILTTVAPCIVGDSSDFSNFRFYGLSISTNLYGGRFELDGSYSV